MTKSKIEPNARSKRIISTSAIFRHVKPRQWMKEVNQHEQDKRRKVENGYKSFLRHKHKQTPEHPLAVALTANIKKSRNHLQEKAEAAIDLTCQDLIQRVTSSSTYFAKSLEALKSVNKKFHEPPSVDKLHFVSTDGNSADTQILGDRMKRFQKVIDNEEQELETLRKKWLEVRQEIINLATEVLPFGGLQGLFNTPDGGVTECISPEQEKVAEELENSKKRWEDEVATVNKRSITKMKSSEEGFNKMHRAQIANLLTLMADDI